jgi:hypothetical protein
MIAASLLGMAANSVHLMMEVMGQQRRSDTGNHYLHACHQTLNSTLHAVS